MNYIILFLFLLPTFPSVTVRNNVGTVLFTEADNLRTCWSDEDTAMLTSRMFFEDILPADAVFDIQNDQFIMALIDYFRMVVNLVSKAAEGKTKHVLLLSLSDCLGGYLHHTALPIARHAYYIGNIKYESMEMIYELYDELKLFLRTDGRSWAPPVKDFSKYKTTIKPIPVITDETFPCEDIIYYENKEGENESVYIPMPFFDTKKGPHAIALPFKNYSLRDIEGKKAAFVVIKFYMSAIKCLSSKNANKYSMFKFYTEFEFWLDKEVIPHFTDDKFYSAFGGVYRIKETIKRARELCETGVTKKVIGSYEILESSAGETQKAMRNQKIAKLIEEEEPFVPLVEEKNNDLDESVQKQRIFKRNVPDATDIDYYGSPSYEDKLDGKTSNNLDETCSKATLFFFWDEDHTKSMILVLALATVLLLWFSIGCFYLCFRIYKRKHSQDPCKIKENKATQRTTNLSCIKKRRSSEYKQKKSEICKQEIKVLFPHDKEEKGTHPHDNQKPGPSHEPTHKKSSSHSLNDEVRKDVKKKESHHDNHSKIDDRKYCQPDCIAKTANLKHHNRTFSSGTLAKSCGRNSGRSCKANRKTKDIKKKPVVYGYDYKTGTDDTSPTTLTTPTTQSESPKRKSWCQKRKESRGKRKSHSPTDTTD